MNPIQSEWGKSFLAEVSFRQLNCCRICKAPFFPETLKLMDTPLANELYSSRESSLDAEAFPLELVMCSLCSHIQLRDIVSPERLFSNYVYRSGTSTFFRKHFFDLAQELSNLVPKGSLVVEVGSNDGFLLGQLESCGLKAVGIEPSEQLASLSRSLGFSVKTGYLSTDLAQEVTKEYGTVSAVVGNNVFAHIDDLLDAFLIVNEMLTNNGLFMFEVADFASLVKNGLFDTIYHEHMSYHTVKGLLKLAELSNFSIEKVDEIEPHGGSLRFLLRKDGREAIASASVIQRVAMENDEGLDHPKVFKTIKGGILKKRESLSEALAENSGVLKFVGYGAPAKLVTFCYQMGLGPQSLEYVIDDNELKQGLFIPGLGYSIVSSSYLERRFHSEWENYAISFLIFPWNLSLEIEDRLRVWAPPGSTIIKAFPNVTRSYLK